LKKWSMIIRGSEEGQETKGKKRKRETGDSSRFGPRESYRGFKRKWGRKKCREKKTA